MIARRAPTPRVLSPEPNSVARGHGFYYRGLVLVTPRRKGRKSPILVLIIGLSVLDSTLDNHHIPASKASERDFLFKISPSGPNSRHSGEIRHSLRFQEGMTPISHLGKVTAPCDG